MHFASYAEQFWVSVFYGLLSAPFLALGGYWVTKGIVRLRQLWQIKRRPTPLNSLSPGQVEVLAKVMTADTFYSPLGQIPCVAYYYTVERYILRSRPTNVDAAYSPFTQQEIEDERLKTEKAEPRVQHWTRVAEGSSSQPFLLSDGSGYLVVDPRGTRMDFGRPMYEYQADAPDRGQFLPEPLRNLIREKGVDPNAMLRFREWLLRPGENALAVGMARPREWARNSAASSTKQFALARFELGRSDSCELLITNLGKGVSTAGENGTLLADENGTLRPGW